MAITMLCDPEYARHGTPERRYANRREDGSPTFEGMYSGQCAGTILDWKTREERDCECECHRSTKS
jgi:hypothetical protein